MGISLTTVPASVAGAPPTHARRAAAARWPARLARVDDDVVPYEAAMTRMGEMARERRTGLASDRLWLLSHPQLYTVGRRTDPADLPDPRFGIPVVRTSRGGQLTYHAPGQLVGYVVADIGGTVNVVPFLHLLEDRLVQAVERLGVPAERRPTPPGSALLTGVWTRATGR
jgi:lipoyl(octanoyl) transferase